MADETPISQASTGAGETLSELASLASPSPAPSSPIQVDAPAAVLAEPDRASRQTPSECPRCGAPHTGYTNRCAECGYRFLVRCPKCGAVNDGEATACGACGQRLISAAHGAWMVGPSRPGLLVRGGATGRTVRSNAAKRRGLKARPQGHSPLFFFVIATGAFVLVLGVLLVLLILAQNPHLLGGLRQLPIASRAPLARLPL
jgi:hypothetical protein